jgi:hypothetical protein
MFDKYMNLGFNNPYYIDREGSFLVRNKFSEIVKEYGNVLYLDTVAVVEIIDKSYILGDRTLINNISRTPWLAKPNISKTKWEYYPVPQHKKNDIPEYQIAKDMFNKICDEIKKYIGNRKNVGLLLSGGMDSRMVAGALEFLIMKEHIVDIEVTCLTWGDLQTRDVVYAKRIADRLKWKWKHYTVSAEDMINNIEETAMHGCEYSPVHLHAIPKMRDDNQLDIVLAGSYGDSVGRAEFQGRNVKNLKPISSNISNIGGLVNQKIFNSCKNEIASDVLGYHQLYPKEEKYMENELDYQLHYMRRGLNPCMELIAEKMDFHQIFTDPGVYGFMWSIDTNRRTNLVYKYMLDEFVTDLSNIPWARTGKIYGSSTGFADTYKKEHHSYATMLGTELLPKIRSLVLSDELSNLGIINRKNILLLLRLIKFFPRKDIYYLEKLLWLASLAIMVKKYNIKSLPSVPRRKTFYSKGRVAITFEYMYNYIKNIVSMHIKN